MLQRATCSTTGHGCALPLKGFAYQPPHFLRLEHDMVLECPDRVPRSAGRILNSSILFQRCQFVVTIPLDRIDRKKSPGLHHSIDWLADPPCGRETTAFQRPRSSSRQPSMKPKRRRTRTPEIVRKSSSKTETSGQIFQHFLT